MIRYQRILAGVTLAGGIAVTSVVLAQTAPTETPPPPPADQQAGDMPMAGPDGPMAPRMPRGHGRGALDFAAIDADGDGVLSREELGQRASERLGAADANGDGSLDREELIAVMPGSRGGPIFDVFAPDPAAERADRLLAYMGAGDAGTIEVQAIAERQVNAALARFDRDHDGAISQDEATAKHGKRHHDRDRGGDRRDRDR